MEAYELRGGLTVVTNRRNDAYSPSTDRQALPDVMITVAAHLCKSDPTVSKIGFS